MSTAISASDFNAFTRGPALASAWGPNAPGPSITGKTLLPACKNPALGRCHAVCGIGRQPVPDKLLLSPRIAHRLPQVTALRVVLNYPASLATLCMPPTTEPGANRTLVTVILLIIKVIFHILIELGIGEHLLQKPRRMSSYARVCSWFL